MKNSALKLLSGLALMAVALIAVPASHAADKAAPLTATFEKVAMADHPPYVLKLKNDSSETLKVSAKVLLSVAAHNADKARLVPAEEVAAGATMTVKDLAAMDKVTVMVEGYANLELEVK